MRIVSAAVKIYDRKLEKKITIPCHRHCDAFVILKEFCYKPAMYKVVAEGFLDEKWNFVDRITAHKIAYDANQITHDEPYKPTELYSEDLW